MPATADKDVGAPPKYLELTSILRVKPIKIFPEDLNRHVS